MQIEVVHRERLDGVVMEDMVENALASGQEFKEPMCVMCVDNPKGLEWIQITYDHCGPCLSLWRKAKNESEAQDGSTAGSEMQRGDIINLKWNFGNNKNKKKW